MWREDIPGCSYDDYRAAPARGRRKQAVGGKVGGGFDATSMRRARTALALGIWFARAAPAVNATGSGNARISGIARHARRATCGSATWARHRGNAPACLRGRGKAPGNAGASPRQNDRFRREATDCSARTMGGLGSGGSRLCDAVGWRRRSLGSNQGRYVDRRMGVAEVLPLLNVSAV